MFSDVKTHLASRHWLVLGFGIIAITLAFDLLRRHDPIGVDLHTYIAAGQIGVEQGWSRIYDQALVAMEQKELSPAQIVQPYLSPPTVAFITAPLGMLPYNTAYVVWAVFLLTAFAGALAWAAQSKGGSKWIAVAGALAPWWVMQAINVGQVVPLVAAGTVVAWRLTRERRDLLAGVALGCILFKPNTAILVPFALFCAMRFRVFASWAAVAAAMAIVVLLLIGPHGMEEYFAQLRGRLPRGADALTLHGALGADVISATALRMLIVAGVLAASYKLRASPTLAIPLAIVGSLLIAPYLHSPDLCMLAAAAWMVWEERPVLAWRVPLALGWVLASPYLHVTSYGPRLRQWPWLEIALLLALVIAAWSPLTSWADSRRRVPA